MLIFAWILWGLILFGWSITTILFIAAFLALNNPEKSNLEVKINIKPFDFLLTIAIFVFLTIYIFGR